MRRPALPSLAAPWLLVAAAALLESGCASSDALHPPPPPTGGLGPIPDPPPSRVVIHTTLFTDGLRAQLDAALPRDGSGEVDLIAGKRVGYGWRREPVAVSFDRGRVVVATTVTGTVKLLGEHSFPIKLQIAGEPVITADWKARLQSISVEVHAEAPVERMSRAVEDALQKLLSAQLDAFRLDVRPTVAAAYDRVSRPLPFRYAGEQTACALLRVTSIEAGPTVLAGDFEKDLGLVVLPSVVMPCPAAPAPAPAPTPAEPAKAPAAAPLPLLANVSSIPSGPFTVTVPIAARYDELSRAMEAALGPGARLHFSREFPDLYLEKPAVYPSRDTVVIKLVLGGAVKVAGSRVSVGGELFFSGHPKVIDNQIVVPDLELTPGTADGLLKLKVLLDGKAIRDQAQAALRVDLSERIAAARDKLGAELSFTTAPAASPAPASPDAAELGGCLRAEALRTEVTGIYPHDTFLRVYVVVNAQASLYLPCRR